MSWLSRCRGWLFPRAQVSDDPVLQAVTLEVLLEHDALLDGLPVTTSG